MITDLLLSVAFLAFLGLTILSGRYARAGIGEVPLMYKSTFIQFGLNLGVIGFLGLVVFLVFFYSWKLFLALLAIGFITEALLIVPLLERILYYFYASLSKIESKDR